MTTRLQVTDKQQLTPSLLRLWFHSEDLSAFTDSQFTDRYVKLVFPQPGVDYPESFDMGELRRTRPAEELPDLRTYTALFPDVAAGTVAIDFVVHGDTGIAGPWALNAEPGDILLANGPGGAYRPNTAADSHLFVGDEAAVPAIVAALEALPSTAVGQAFVLVDDGDHEPPLPARPGVQVTFLHRNDGDGTGLLEKAVREWAWPGQDAVVEVFAHGEAHEIMHGVRPYLFGERKLPRNQVSISGYWRRGRTEPGFREWKAELRAVDPTA